MGEARCWQISLTVLSARCEPAIRDGHARFGAVTSAAAGTDWNLLQHQVWQPQPWRQTAAIWPYGERQDLPLLAASLWQSTPYIHIDEANGCSILRARGEAELRFCRSCFI